MLTYLLGIISVLYVLLDDVDCNRRSLNEEKGPRFLTEPPSKMEFSNNSGAELRCRAEGSPSPVISWQGRESGIVRDIPGLRYIRADGTLVITPFLASDYRQDVHDAVYACVASNSVGSVVSKDTHVRGVVQQNFTPQVYDDYVIRGNTAVFRCHLPSYVREYVTLDSWIRNDDVVLKEADAQDDKYTVLPSGELLLYNAQDSDSRSNFRCRARHRLTGELVISTTAGKVTVTEPHSPMAPRITFSQSQVRAEEGGLVRIPCVSQSQPFPSYRWMKETSGGFFPILEDARINIVSGTLHIKSAVQSDSGKYQCIVKNSFADRKTETVLLVTGSLKIAIVPDFKTLNIGEAVVLNCTVTGYPIHTVTWKKDTRHFVSNSRMQLLSREVLHITSVRREDKGMYQCFAYNDGDAAQGTAEIRIGDVPPYLLSAFPETTVHPGEVVSLKCVSVGNSIPRVTWMLDGQALSRNSRIRMGDHVSAQGHVYSYLNITDTRVEDGGEYQCEITNDIGSVSHAGNLNVYGPPFVRRFRNISAISGLDLVLKCPVGGYPIKSTTWQKGGIVLPLNHRQKIDVGILTIQNVQRAADEGEYTCIAKNPDGEVATGSTYVSVVVAPVIDAQYFPEIVTANEGSRTKIICSVTTGDPPIRFQWLKNGFPFSAGGKISVQMLEDSSIVIFRKVKANDRGQYTCIASNMATSMNMTSQLIVNVAPSWMSEPQNTSVVQGGIAWMNCSAAGYPSPSVVWRKARGDSGIGDFGYVHSTPRIRQYNNGTLVVWEVEEMDGGPYLCQANNGIGAGLSKVIHLKVQVPPKFLEAYQSRAVKEGENISLKCVVKGDLPIKLVWSKNKAELPVQPNPRYILKETLDEKTFTSELVISSASRQDSNLYTCAAKNSIGSEEATYQLIVQGVPDPPTNLTATNISSRTVSIQWEIPFNGNSHITGSSVQYKGASDNWKGHTSQLIVSGSENSAILRALHPVTTYHLRVITENVIGKSRPSYIINVTTDVEAPSGPPREISVHPTGDQSLKVTWKPPREDSRHGQIQGYYVGHKVYHAAEKYQLKQVEANHDAEVQSTYVTGLQPFTKYEVVVKAYNRAGSGPSTESVIGVTLETAPPTSPILHVTSKTTTSIDIRWEKDSKDKSSITEYTLHYKPFDGTWMTKKLRSTTDRYRLEHLRCGTNYNMYLTASNSLGTGEPSLSVNVRTKGAAPIPAPHHSFISLNWSSVILHLDGWQSGGCPIQYFTIQYRPEHHSQWIALPEKIPATKDKTLLSQLISDRDYRVMITAYSEAGVTQEEYKYRTLPMPPIETTSIPALVKGENDLPFHRNVALLIPVVVSSLVLIIVIFTVVVCLRKHSQERRGHPDYHSQKAATDSLLMSEVSQKSSSGKQAINGSHYSSPSRGPMVPKNIDQRRTDKQHEYAEPYISFPSSRQRSDEGSFATIKRAPPRSGSMASAYKPGLDVIGGHQMAEHDKLDYSSMSSQSEMSGEKQSTVSSGSHRPLR